MMNNFLLLLCIFAGTSVSAFCPAHTIARRRLQSIPLNLVTEADVIALVEEAEKLWGKVEKLRNEANDLSVQAETLGQNAEISTADAIKSLKGSISEKKLEEANDAQNLSIDLGSLVEKALAATEEADKTETLANEALAASERALEQHLIDFPEDDAIDNS
mmetsp:Transcript_31409/g.75927  ORF Transcript_31409/g.75927 Transcript_31409/m.75927 type:complete len:161 (+) Transcript_31409:77-559(+)